MRKFRAKTILTALTENKCKSFVIDILVRNLKLNIPILQIDGKGR